MLALILLPHPQGLMCAAAVELQIAFCTMVAGFLDYGCPKNAYTRAVCAGSGML